MYRLVGKYLSNDYTGTIDPRTTQILQKARTISNDVVLAGLIACKHGRNVVNKVLNEYKHVLRGSKDWQGMYAAFKGFEMKLNSISQKIRDGHGDLRTQGYYGQFGKFNIESSTIKDSFGYEEAYRCIGIFVVLQRRYICFRSRRT